MEWYVADVTDVTNVADDGRKRALRQARLRAGLRHAPRQHERLDRNRKRPARQRSLYDATRQRHHVLVAPVRRDVDVRHVADERRRDVIGQRWHGV